MLNLSRNRGTYDGAAFFQDDSGIAEKKISLNRLISWENQPFEPYTDEAMATLAASIEENGLLSPIIVAPDGDKYRIIAGHNRVRACERSITMTYPMFQSALTAKLSAGLLERSMTAWCRSI